MDWDLETIRQTVDPKAHLTPYGNILNLPKHQCSLRASGSNGSNVSLQELDLARPEKDLVEAIRAAKKVYNIHRTPR